MRKFNSGISVLFYIALFQFASFSFGEDEITESYAWAYQPYSPDLEPGPLYSASVSKAFLLYQHQITQIDDLISPTACQIVSAEYDLICIDTTTGTVATSDSLCPPKPTQNTTSQLYYKNCTEHSFEVVPVDPSSIECIANDAPDDINPNDYYLNEFKCRIMETSVEVDKTIENYDETSCNSLLRCSKPTYKLLTNVDDEIEVTVDDFEFDGSNAVCSIVVGSLVRPNDVFCRDVTNSFTVPVARCESLFLRQIMGCQSSSFELVHFKDVFPPENEGNGNGNGSELEVPNGNELSTDDTDPDPTQTPSFECYIDTSDPSLIDGIGCKVNDLIIFPSLSKIYHAGEVLPLEHFTLTDSVYSACFTSVDQECTVYKPYYVNSMKYDTYFSQLIDQHPEILPPTTYQDYCDDISRYMAYLLVNPLTPGEIGQSTPHLPEQPICDIFEIRYECYSFVTNQFILEESEEHPDPSNSLYGTPCGSSTTGRPLDIPCLTGCEEGNFRDVDAPQEPAALDSFCASKTVRFQQTGLSPKNFSVLYTQSTKLGVVIQSGDDPAPEPEPEPGNGSSENPEEEGQGEGQGQPPETLNVPIYLSALMEKIARKHLDDTCKGFYRCLQTSLETPDVEAYGVCPVLTCQAPDLVSCVTKTYIEPSPACIHLAFASENILLPEDCDVLSLPTVELYCPCFKEVEIETKYIGQSTKCETLIDDEGEGEGEGESTTGDNTTSSDDGVTEFTTVGDVDTHTLTDPSNPSQPPQRLLQQYTEQKFKYLGIDFPLDFSCDTIVAEPVQEEGEDEGEENPPENENPPEPTNPLIDLFLSQGDQGQANCRRIHQEMVRLRSFYDALYGQMLGFHITTGAATEYVQSKACNYYILPGANYDSSCCQGFECLLASENQTQPEGEGEGEGEGETEEPGEGQNPNSATFSNEISTQCIQIDENHQFLHLFGQDCDIVGLQDVVELTIQSDTCQYFDTSICTEICRIGDVEIKFDDVKCKNAITSSIVTHSLCNFTSRLTMEKCDAYFATLVPSDDNDTDTGTDTGTGTDTDTENGGNDSENGSNNETEPPRPQQIPLCPGVALPYQWLLHDDADFICSQCDNGAQIYELSQYRCVLPNTDPNTDPDPISNYLPSHNYGFQPLHQTTKNRLLSRRQHFAKYPTNATSSSLVKVNTAYLNVIQNLNTDPIYVDAWYSNDACIDVPHPTHDSCNFRDQCSSVQLCRDGEILRPSPNQQSSSNILGIFSSLSRSRSLATQTVQTLQTLPNEDANEHDDDDDTLSNNNYPTCYCENNRIGLDCIECPTLCLNGGYYKDLPEPSPTDPLVGKTQCEVCTCSKYYNGEKCSSVSSEISILLEVPSIPSYVPVWMNIVTVAVQEDLEQLALELSNPQHTVTLTSSITESTDTKYVVVRIFVRVDPIQSESLTIFNTFAVHNDNNNDTGNGNGNEIEIEIEIGANTDDDTTPVVVDPEININDTLSRVFYTIAAGLEPGGRLIIRPAFSSYVVSSGIGFKGPPCNALLTNGMTEICPKCIGKCGVPPETDPTGSDSGSGPGSDTGSDTTSTTNTTGSDSTSDQNTTDVDERGDDDKMDTVEIVIASVISSVVVVGIICLILACCCCNRKDTIADDESHESDDASDEYQNNQNDDLVESLSQRTKDNTNLNAASKVKVKLYPKDSV